MNTGFHWTVHEASQVLYLQQTLQELPAGPASGMDVQEAATRLLLALLLALLLLDSDSGRHEHKVK